MLARPSLAFRRDLRGETVPTPKGQCDALGRVALRPCFAANAFLLSRLTPQANAIAVRCERAPQRLWSLPRVLTNSGIGPLKLVPIDRANLSVVAPGPGRSEGARDQ